MYIIKENDKLDPILSKMCSSCTLTASQLHSSEKPAVTLALSLPFYYKHDSIKPPSIAKQN